MARAFSIRYLNVIVLEKRYGSAISHRRYCILGLSTQIVITIHACRIAVPQEASKVVFVHLCELVTSRCPRTLITRKREYVLQYMRALTMLSAQK